MPCNIPQGYVIASDNGQDSEYDNYLAQFFCVGPKWILGRYNKKRMRLWMNQIDNPKSDFVKFIATHSQECVVIVDRYWLAVKVANINKDNVGEMLESFQKAGVYLKSEYHGDIPEKPLL